MPSRIKSMAQRIVQVKKEYRDLLKEKEKERKMCGVPLRWHKCIHYAKWPLKRGDACCGFITKDGLLKKIAILSYIHL